MLHTITILTALTATGMMGHGKHCGGGGKMHLVRARTMHSAAPVSTCGAAMTYAPAMMAQPTMPMAAAQAPTMMNSTSVYATPSQPVAAPIDTVPPAPVVPPAPAPPAPPSS